MTTRFDYTWDKLIGELLVLKTNGMLFSSEYAEFYHAIEDVKKSLEAKHPRETSTMDCEELQSKQLHLKD